MKEKRLMQGNQAMAEAAILGGARFFAGYPITPQTPFAEYLSWRLPQAGGVYLQANSETAVIGCVWGASVSGERALTATSGPGLSLMQEGLSGMLVSGLPAVVVDIARAGAGTGGLNPAQMDYNLITKGCGHGGLHPYAVVPIDVQEAVDLLYNAYDFAEKERTVYMMLCDGMMGESYETVALPEPKEIPSKDDKPWAINGCAGRKPKLTTDQAFIYGSAHAEELKNYVSDVRQNWMIEYDMQGYAAKYERWRREEVKYETYLMEDAEYVILAYGTPARIAKSAVRELRKEGYKVGLFRPITIYPFPEDALASLDDTRIKGVLAYETAQPAQFVEDVRHALNKKIRLASFCHTGFLPKVEEYMEHMKSLMGGNT